MQDKEIKIRLAVHKDINNIFEWRFEEHSKDMSFNEKIPTREEHSIWFNRSLRSKNRILYVGTINKKSIGVCRFDLDSKEFESEVSINMDPEMRGKGLGQKFLSQCVMKYLETHSHDLFAKIKPKNLASLKIFKSIGFGEYSNSNAMIVLKKPINNLIFKEVRETDVEALFVLLEQRTFSISHKSMPSKSEHLNFVKSVPYRYWFLIYEQDNLVGSFYIQKDNSIGLNLLRPNKTMVQSILNYIKKEFKPLPEVKTKIPDYFYLNVPYANDRLKEILDDLGSIPIQVSYKIA